MSIYLCIHVSRYKRISFVDGWCVLTNEAIASKKKKQQGGVCVRNARVDVRNGDSPHTRDAASLAHREMSIYLCIYVSRYKQMQFVDGWCVWANDAIASISSTPRDMSIDLCIYVSRYK